MNPTVENHLADLRKHWPQATAQPMSGDAVRIYVPGLHLPPGWNLAVVDVWIVAPNGYPFAPPDCFWTSPELRLASQQLPQATGLQPLPETAQSALWFSWHVQSWNPNRDSLTTFMNVVRRRFEQLQ
jgi:hypothetical protein